MKKSEITVSMPMTSYEELIYFKNIYHQLVKKLTDCYNTNLFDNNVEKNIQFDFRKCEKITKEFISSKYQDVDVEFVDIE